MPVVAANQTFFEKANLLRVALNSYTMAAEDAMKPGGGIKTDWSGRLTTAMAALTAANTAFATAIGNEVPVPSPTSINPAIGYGSMTGAAGVAVAPNP